MDPISARKARVVLASVLAGSVTIWHSHGIRTESSQGGSAQAPTVRSSDRSDAPAAASLLPIEPDMQIDVACADEGLVAHVLWQRPLTPVPTGAGGADRPRLEVTIFQDGFARGLLATLRQTGLIPTFHLPQWDGPELTFAPLLSSLTPRVSLLSQPIDDHSPRLTGLLQQAGLDVPLSQVVVVEIVGLSGGVNYFWRSRPEGMRVMTPAPFCPMDPPGGSL